MTRHGGILLPVFSLPSPWGIGDVGSRARNFVDWLAQAGQHYWQMLPLTHTKEIFGNSPYSSLSAFACSPLLASIEDLIDEGLIYPNEISLFNEEKVGKVHYGLAEKLKMPLLEKAFQRFIQRANMDPLYLFWEEQRWWLNDFALFMAIRHRIEDDRWNLWPASIRQREKQTLDTIRSEEKEYILFTVFVQYVVFSQFQKLRSYCRSRNVELIGDLPIYVSFESADVWGCPEMFQLNADMTPIAVSGVPPDYFSSTGQRWGNPLYRWDYAQDNSFHWWIKRLEHVLHFFDLVRFDHFRGFLAYWSIPYEEKTAVKGHWEEGPNDNFFSAIKEKFSTMPFIAENLGIITPDVTEAMKRYDLPGMLVLLFAFDESMPRNPYILHNHTPNNFIYTGTHDNNTVKGWFDEDSTTQEKERLSTYTNTPLDRNNVTTVLTRLALMSVADTAIIPLQDYLNLGSEGRINTPSTIEGNWQWMLTGKELTDSLAASLHSLMTVYGRI